MKSITNDFEEVKLVYRNKMKAKERPLINSSNSAYDILKKTWDLDQIDLIEEFKILLLDAQLRLMSIAPISIGGVMGTIADPKIVFALALKRRASRIILAHNHPTGITKPSKTDITLTKRFIAAGKILQIDIVDHLIVTSEDYFSLKDGCAELDFQ